MNSSADKNFEKHIEDYYNMLRIRLVEEAIADNYGKREMHTPIHLCIGEEAVAVGVCRFLRKADIVYSNHRSHGHYLAKGGDLKSMMAELHNKETGCCHGRGASMHLMDEEAGVSLTSSIVAGSVSIAVGGALAFHLKGSNNIAVSFMGDAATEEGNVYESICFAALHKLPVIFVCENNMYSICTSLSKREPVEDICDKFKGILPVESVDGNNIYDIEQSAGSAIERARCGKGPTFIECRTYRWRDHHNIGTGVELGYRTKEELEYWIQKCPIRYLEKTLLEEGRVNEAYLVDIRKRIKTEIEEAFSYARASELPRAADLQKGLWR